MRLFASFLLVTSLIITSCNNSKSDANYDKSIMPEGYDPNAKVEATATNPNEAVTNNSLNANPALVPNTGVTQTIQQQQPMQVTQMQNNAPATNRSNAIVASGLNPAHGQPGHRCDIPEGSPLSSAPTGTVNAPQTITSTPSPAPKTITAAGMNPAHGEPGHRCDISVGAPLNSPAPAANVQNQPPVSPVTVNSPAKEMVPTKSGQ
jgi:hypothetical protein